LVIISLLYLDISSKEKSGVIKSNFFENKIVLEMPFLLKKQ
jgi:hypothetical protein